MSAGPGGGLLADLLPAGTHAAEEFGDPPDAVLLPEEEAHVARAVDKRRREYTTVRHCARRALAALGRPPAALLPGERGAPGWPEGVVGSMTHCDGYRAAAVADRAEVDAVGIDAEPHGPLPDGVLDAVTSARERDHLDELARTVPGLHGDRLLFSAKESVYKAWFPLTARWLGFEDAELEFTPQPAADGSFRGRFHARLLTAGHDPQGRVLDAFDGRWLVRRGLVVTTVARLPERPRTPAAGPGR